MTQTDGFVDNAAWDTVGSQGIQKLVDFDGSASWDE